jgi:peptide/nickel transport system substrate-binding protein
MKSVDLNALVNTMYSTAEFDAVMGISAGFYLPAAGIPFFTGPTPPNGRNFAAVNNPDYTQLAEKALTQPGKAGCPTWNQAYAAFFKNADMLPIADGVGKIFGYKTEFAVTPMTSVSLLIPTSIRMHK